MSAEAPAEPLGGTDDDRRHHWVVPVVDGAHYVPDANAVAAIVEGLARSEWLRWEPRPPYDPDGPFYYSTFDGTTDGAEPVAADCVIRRSHCKTIGVMVNGTLLIAPTARARGANAPCPACGASVLEVAVKGASRSVPSECPACGAIVRPRDLGTLPLFRFAVWIELWYPRSEDTVLSVDPDLLRPLEELTGYVFRDEGQ